MIPYDVNVAPWSDGAKTQRWLALPQGATLGINGDGDWELPVGSVLMKRFQLSGKPVETQLLVRHDDGDWGGYSYQWNDAGTDATWVRNGKVRMVGNTQWIYPSSAQCRQCHTATDRPLGLETVQLNRDFTYAVTGRTANQLATFEAIDLLARPLGAEPSTLPALPDPQSPQVPLAKRARAYLHANCAHCHQASSRINVSGLTKMDFRYTIPFRDMSICNQKPFQRDLGIPDARLLKPGDPGRSMILVRMARRDIHGMPPVGSSQTDAAGVELIGKTIMAISSCP